MTAYTASLPTSTTSATGAGTQPPTTPDTSIKTLSPPEATTVTNQIKTQG